MIARVIARLIAMVFLSSSPSLYAKEIFLQCVSKKSALYDVYFDTQLQTGEIRYRWMGQDVFYSVYLKTKSNWFIFGEAIFKGSLSGELRGNPFEFSYNSDTKTLSELVDAQCIELVVAD